VDYSAFVEARLNLITVVEPIPFFPTPFHFPQGSYLDRRRAPSDALIRLIKPTMLKQLLLALGLTSVTVILHAVGTVHVVLPLAAVWSRKRSRHKPPTSVMTLIRLVSGLLLLHVVEMGVWAAVFTVVGVLPDFETSLYFSLKSYTTVGYGDVLPPQSWRLLGPIEAAVGVLMLGWSTGVIVASVQRIYGDRVLSAEMEQDEQK
jgi:voltage-gated potassium channel